MSNNKKIYYSSLSDIELYEELLEGIVDTFPSGFWVNRGLEEAREVAKKLLRYLLIEKLKYTKEDIKKEDIKKEVSKKFITKYKLHTASKFFGRSSIKYVLESIPELGLQPWQFHNDYVPKNYWTIEENRVSALRHLFEVELKWNIEEVKEKLNWEILEKNGLMTLRIYYPNLWQVFKAAYNIDVEPWELRNSEVPTHTWENKENRVKAIRWLVNRLDSNTTVIDRKTFAQYGLSSLLADYYGENAIRAVKDALRYEEYKKLKYMKKKPYQRNINRNNVV